MSTSSKYYDAHETSYADDVAVALLCGDADWKMYAGVQTVDGHRVKFAYSGWKSLLAVKILRGRMRAVTNAALSRSKSGSENGNGDSGIAGNMGNAERWMEIWREVVVSRRRLGEKKE